MPLMIKRIWALFLASTIEFYRDRSSLAWSLLFPFLIVGGFSVMFNSENQSLYTAGIISTPSEKNTNPAYLNKSKIDQQRTKQLAAFYQLKHIERVIFNDTKTALHKLKHHRIDILIQQSTGKYWINESAPKGYIAEKMLLAATAPKEPLFQKQVITGKRIRYADWLFPGVLGMNMMFSGLFGVGYAVVRYRKNGLLKRLSVTPVRAWEYLVAQILSRFFVMFITTLIVYVLSVFLYDFECQGSFFALFAIFSAGAFTMISVGLLVAARMSSEELAAGILNLVSWPMMFLSGVWFSLESTAPWVQTLSLFFPLTHLIEGGRKIMNDGAGFSDILLPFSILMITSFILISIGALLFQWHKK